MLITLVLILNTFQQIVSHHNSSHNQLFTHERGECLFTRCWYARLV